MSDEANPHLIRLRVTFTFPAANRTASGGFLAATRTVEAEGNGTTQRSANQDAKRQAGLASVRFVKVVKTELVRG